MRHIVLDTETTGLEWRKGNRVVEIGCVELIERRPSGRTFQKYLDPQRDFEPGAQEVTGLTREFLADKPKFAEVVDAFLEFIDGAELIIHNAAFDVGFLDNELSLLAEPRGTLREHAGGITDSLEMARQRYPGQRNSLDALCRRLGVDNSHRQLHGALLDAQLLAEAWLAMTSGQSEIGFAAFEAPVCRPQVVSLGDAPPRERPRIVLSDDDLAAHARRVDAIRKKAGRCLWDA